MEDRPCTQPWHETARFLHGRGLSNGEIGKLVGRSRETVRCFLNPYAYEKWLTYQRRWYAEKPTFRKRKDDRRTKQRQKPRRQTDKHDANHCL